MKFFEEILPEFANLDIKMIAVRPKVYQQYRSANDDFYPFSLTHLLNCLERNIKMEPHPTLSGDQTFFTVVTLFFFRSHRGSSFSLDKLLKSGFHGLITIPFHTEEKGDDERIPPNLIVALEDALSTIMIAHKTGYSEEADLFLNMFKAIKLKKFEDIAFDVQSKAFLSEISDLLN